MRFVAEPTAMHTREPMLPLAISLIASLALHALLLPSVLGWNSPAPGESRRSELASPDAPQAVPPDDPTFGQETSNVSSVAWIAYDDFRELIARQSAVEQPTLQQQEDPAPDAPMQLDPTPPEAPETPETPEAPNTLETPEPLIPAPPAPLEPSVPAQLAEALPPAPLVPPTLPRHAPAVPLHLPEPADAGDLPRVSEAPLETDAETETETETETESVPPQQASPAPAPAPEARPTSSPRSDRESPPATRTESQLPVQPGRVVARQGIKIKTAVPRFSAITLASTLPRNPEATLIFDSTGQVVEVTLTRSSGAANVDGPLVASLYRWRATGDRIDQLGDATLEMNVKILLVKE